MFKLRNLVAGAFAAGLLAAPAMAPSAMAQEETKLPSPGWSFDGPFGTIDQAAAQRGFQIYLQVCSNCHAAHLLHYRDLTGIGLTEEQIKAKIADITVPSGLDDQGQPKDGPATLASQFRSPYPNDIAARAALNGALPPDLSLIVNAREGGADYVYGILTGFVDPPAGFKLQDGMNYNAVFPGHQIAMPQPLSDGTVDYTDGTKNDLNQEAHDVVTFLTWAANPEQDERKSMGVRIVAYFLLMAGVVYGVKRKLWAKLH